MNRFRASFVVCLSLSLTLAHGATLQPPAEAFMAAFAPLCGQAYAGQVLVDVPPSDDDRFAGKPLIMHVASCTEDEIRIPFFVDDDRSRTWVLSRTATGLRLKHDHRHEDGSEDAVTWYGGTATTAGTAERQEFPVDTESIDLFVKEGLSASTSNVWAMEIETGIRFLYELSRPNGRLFQVGFDLSAPVATPPPPWGAGTARVESDAETMVIDGLEWAVATNGIDLKWPEAVDYCDTLELAGHSDWRLPTLAELKSLHEPDAPGGEAIRSPFTIGGCCLWSSETLVDRPDESGDETAGKPENYHWGFMFDGGLHYYAVHIFDDGRALCAREN
jgi:hypothetical protein